MKKAELIGANTLKARFVAPVRRAFQQFLGLPTAVVSAFVILAVATYWADGAWSGDRAPAGFTWLGRTMGNRESLASLLSTIASSIITVTSITFSLLLIALQQGSSALTAEVSDQFLMRRSNQFYFGFFVGLSVYVLITMVTVNEMHRPVFGGTIALALTTIALFMIVIMIYNTIDQMRPNQIVRAIHRHILSARNVERDRLKVTRRTSQVGHRRIATYRVKDTGYLTGFDVDGMRVALAERELNGYELEVLKPVGSFMAFGDPAVGLNAPGGASAHLPDGLEDKVLDALRLDADRNLGRDASYGIEQLATIAWTSTSTAKSNPSPTFAVLSSLRDILSRWSQPECASDEDPNAPIVYPDVALWQAVDVIELIFVAASESIQAQTLTACLHTTTFLMESMALMYHARLAEVVERALSGLGEHVMTREVEDALSKLILCLDSKDLTEVSHKVRKAKAEFATTVGALNSRSTRVPSKV